MNTKNRRTAALCGGKRFLPWQAVKKNVRDREYDEVTARRYKCLQGVQSGQVSQRVKGMGVMLYLLVLIHERQPSQQVAVQALYERYACATAPKKKKMASVAYCLRNLFLNRWNLWPRLTFYRTWKNREGQPILDGTNNADERAIGWWVKERYRSIRGYKRIQSALNVSRLIAYCGNHLQNGLPLASIVT